MTDSCKIPEIIKFWENEFYSHYARPKNKIFEIKIQGLNKKNNPTKTKQKQSAEVKMHRILMEEGILSEQQWLSPFQEDTQFLPHE